MKKDISDYLDDIMEERGLAYTDYSLTWLNGNEYIFNIENIEILDDEVQGNIEFIIDDLKDEYNMDFVSMNKRRVNGGFIIEIGLVDEDEEIEEDDREDYRGIKMEEIKCPECGNEILCEYIDYGRNVTEGYCEKCCKTLVKHIDY